MLYWTCVLSIVSNDRSFSTHKQWKHHALHQRLLRLNEPLTPILHTSELPMCDKKKKILMYFINIKFRLFFCPNKPLSLTPTFKKITDLDQFYFLESNKQFFSTYLIEVDVISALLIAKYLLFYFSYTMHPKWYTSPKILRYIRRLYFYETGYAFKNYVPPLVILKNVYSHSLFNCILRCVYLVDSKKVTATEYLHPFLQRIYNVVTLPEKENYDNFYVILNFFSALLSEEFMYDNKLLFKEIEDEVYCLLRDEEKDYTLLKKKILFKYIF